MEPFQFHVFACTQAKPEGVPCCSAAGSWQLLAALEQNLQSRGLDDCVQLSTCGCLGLCDEGPLLVVYPEGTWYRRVKVDDVPEIVDSHLKTGKPVGRLVWNEPAAMKTAMLDHRNQYRAMLKARDQAGVLPDDLNEMIRGFMPSRAVLTALELDLFTAVGEGANTDQVAETIQANPRATEMLLNALVSLGHLQKSDETFRNTGVGHRFLAEGSRDNARPSLLHTANLWHRWSTLTECVRAGTAVDSTARNGTWTKSFIAAMDRNAHERASAVVKAVGLDGARRMLDLGGGSGAYSIEFAHLQPELRVEVLDTAGVIPLTEDYIRRADLADRISARAGDMLRDQLGNNRYDLVLLSAICHMFSMEENAALLKRIYTALAPKGRLVIQDFVLEADKAHPRFAALFALNMLTGTRAGSSYSEPEYAEWMRQAGFNEIHRIKMHQPGDLMIGLKT